MPQHSAIERLAEYGRRYPLAWDLYAEFQHLRLMKRRAGPLVPGFESVHDWPEWCYAPIAAAHAVITTTRHPQAVRRIDHKNKIPPHLLAPTYDTGALAAVAAWRATQGIYRFDQDVLQALYDTPIKGDIPTDVLRRMPAWCVYVETPTLKNMFKDLKGFFAFLEYDAVDGHDELRFALDVEGQSQLVPLLMRLGGSLEECVDKTREVMENLTEKYRLEFPEVQAMRRMLEGFTSIVLFLCSDEAEVPPSPPKPDRVAKTQKGRQICPTGRPTVLECGARLGAALRKARVPRWAGTGEEETARTLQGHIRRPHWHTFLTGPRDGQQRRIVKWLPTIRVGLDDEELPTPTIHRVQDE